MGVRYRMVLRERGSDDVINDMEEVMGHVLPRTGEIIDIEGEKYEVTAVEHGLFRPFTDITPMQTIREVVRGIAERFGVPEITQGSESADVHELHRRWENMHWSEATVTARPL